MNRWLSLILVLGLAPHAFAEARLHTVRCMTKDLTLEATLQTNGTSSEGLGQLAFEAFNKKGIALLGGQETKKINLYALADSWATGAYFTTSASGRILNSLQSQEDVEDELKAQSPALYFHVSSSQIIDAQVSYVAGNRIQWDHCEIDLSEVVCPKLMSDESRDLLFAEAARFKKDGTAGVCVQSALNERLARHGKTYSTASPAEISAAFSDLMAGAAKAEFGER